MANEANGTVVKRNGFLKSNLFVFLLGQAFAFICWLCIFAFGWGKYSERFEGHDKRLNSLEASQKGIDERATTAKSAAIQLTKELGEAMARVGRVEQETAHFDVMESENRRLTKDVEELKSGKK